MLLLRWPVPRCYREQIHRTSGRLRALRSRVSQIRQAAREPMGEPEAPELLRGCFQMEERARRWIAALRFLTSRCSVRFATGSPMGRSANGRQADSQSANMSSILIRLTTPRPMDFGTWSTKSGCKVQFLGGVLKNTEQCHEVSFANLWEACPRNQCSSERCSRPWIRAAGLRSRHAMVQFHPGAPQGPSDGTACRAHNPMPLAN